MLNLKNLYKVFREFPKHMRNSTLLPDPKLMAALIIKEDKAHEILGYDPMSLPINKKEMDCLLFFSKTL